jgi:zinc and cadmium transporter
MTDLANVFGPIAPWVTTLAAVTIVSLISLIGAVGFVLRPERLRPILPILIAFAAGALLGDAFLHLLPEIAESDDGLDAAASFAVLGGLLGFFVLEKFLHWHHQHVPTEEVLHPVAVTNLVGDALHNFIDGAIIAAAFLASPEVGLATAIAVALHEIPQELGDFGILVHAGLPPRRALAVNLASAFIALLGAALTLAVSSGIPGLERVLVPLTAGGFIYIAATDLIPELHKEPEGRKSLLQLAGILAGVAIMGMLLLLE